MNDRILVTYATMTDSTSEVAKAIGQQLRDAGADVEIYPANQVADLSPYTAAVVGSGVRWGKPYAEALTFLKEQQQALGKIPVAYYIVCGTMEEDTEENRHRASSYMDALQASAPHVRPVAIELFGGRVDYDKISRLPGLMLKLMRKPKSDFRNWDAIRSWAEDLTHVLLDVTISRGTVASVRDDLARTPDPKTARRIVPVPG